ncbi:MAG TPA: beta-galactosidase, partial [Terriglobales bacterium]
RASFTVDAPRDTFLDTRALVKGVAWVNGHMLGRFWNIGPQRTLYVPGPWLRKGRNEIVVFDPEGQSGRSAGGLNSPILNELGTK